MCTGDALELACYFLSSNMVDDEATLRLKTQRINTLIGGKKKEDKESG